MSRLTLGGHVRGNDQNSPSTPLVSEAESKVYYAGLPSQPKLIARTGGLPYEPPTGPEAYTRTKQLRIAGPHEIGEIWEDDLAPKVDALLRAHSVDSTSLDVLRIGYDDDTSCPVVLWIGVEPGSVSFERGAEVVSLCKELLAEHHIDDVNVEIRESVVRREAGPALLEPSFDIDPTVEVREPFTATLGITICAKATPWVEGTSGFFLGDAADSTKLYLVTARHVVYQPDKENNKVYERENPSTPRNDVLVLSNASFQKHLDSIEALIDDQDVIIEYQTGRISRVAGRNDAMAVMEREDAEDMRRKAERKKDVLKDFLEELSTKWAPEANRILGFVRYAPPIVVGAGVEGYTQDIAVIEVDASKIDPALPAGNAIDLGKKFAPDALTRMMHPNVKNTYNFSFPSDRLLHIWGHITDDEMRKPAMYDQEGERCIMVLKRGRTTGLTVGRANNICSYTRDYFNEGDGVAKKSKEWAIIPFDNKSGPFSAKGDSGSVIVDGAGRLGGILTGGAGATDSSDVTYATPGSFVLKVINAYQPLARTYIKNTKAV
ncbi:hypothetical protein C8Q79DRAFT_924809 [Trametes meyenii]|nr:hypothetical protein C8Q79DRAFT_924809 [Trametes meyenii]